MNGNARFRSVASSPSSSKAYTEAADTATDSSTTNRSANPSEQCLTLEPLSTWSSLSSSLSHRLNTTPQKHRFSVTSPPSSKVEDDPSAIELVSQISTNQSSKNRRSALAASSKVGVVTSNNTMTNQHNHQQHQAKNRHHGQSSNSRTSSNLRNNSEIDPLLTPPYDPSYTNETSINDSVHRSTESTMSDQHLSTSPSTSRQTEDTIVAFPEEVLDDDILDDDIQDRALLIADKPTQIRTQQSSTNVILLNFLALVFVSFNMTLNLTVLAIIHERVPMTEPHLPDIAFDLLPDIRSLLDVSEYYIVFQMTSVFVLLFFHRHRSIILRRVCIIMGVIYFFRGICMASTQLPLASRNYTCSAQLKNSTDYANMTSIEFIGIIASRVFFMSLGMGLSINGHHSYCGDYIFSGHTVILLLTYLTFQEYLLPARRKNLFWRLYQIFLIVMTCVSIVCIIIARGHYFIDVILAYFVTTRIFWIYHAMCNSNMSNMKAFVSYFSRLWWWPVFLYFENIKPTTPHAVGSVKLDDVPNQVQRVFEWPLPYPKKLARRKHRNQFMA